jgi:hypothetical protein
LRDRKLSQAASDLIQFDADSIRQVVSGQRLTIPDVWLADPDAYEKNGRVLRDSETSRLLAYSKKDRVLYATDGCNSCARRLQTDMALLAAPEVDELARDSDIPPELLRKLVRLIASS